MIDSSDEMSLVGFKMAYLRARRQPSHMGGISLGDCFLILVLTTHRRVRRWVSVGPRSKPDVRRLHVVISSMKSWLFHHAQGALECRQG